MKSSVSPSLRLSASILRIAASRSSRSIGRYPRNRKRCPFMPLAMSVKSMEQGPTRGLTGMPSSEARRTIPAPGSATAGHPDSLTTAVSEAPTFVMGASHASNCPASGTCPISMISSVSMGPGWPATFRNRRAERAFSARNRRQFLSTESVCAGSTASGSVSAIRLGRR